MTASRLDMALDQCRDYESFAKLLNQESSWENHKIFWEDTEAPARIKEKFQEIQSQNPGVDFRAISEKISQMDQGVAKVFQQTVGAAESASAGAGAETEATSAEEKATAAEAESGVIEEIEDFKEFIGTADEEGARKALEKQECKQGQTTGQFYVIRKSTIPGREGYWITGLLSSGRLVSYGPCRSALEVAFNKDHLQNAIKIQDQNFIGKKGESEADGILRTRGVKAGQYDGLFYVVRQSPRDSNPINYYVTYLDLTNKPKTTGPFETMEQITKQMETMRAQLQSPLKTIPELEGLKNVYVGSIKSENLKDYFEKRGIVAGNYEGEFYIIRQTPGRPGYYFTYLKPDGSLESIQVNSKAGVDRTADTIRDKYRIKKSL